MDGSNLVGKTLAGRYKLIKMIGQGGMGSVFQGQDQQMSNKVVAIKILAPHLVSDEKQVLRFEQEARAANQLRHPNTISVLDFGRSDHHIFMALEFLTGETLTAVLKRGRLDTTRCLYMIRQVLKSLAEAHSKGIIHRDLKPDNIFVCDIYGEKDFIKVIDFGIAKFLEAGGAELTQAGKMFGTPRYLSPEQAQGLPLSAASDLYSLGVILFEMLTGRPPFVAEDPIAVAIKHVQEPPPRFADVDPDLYVPEELDHLVFKMLAKKAANRHQSSEEVLEAIDGVMAVLHGGRYPSGQFSAVGNRTPGKPTTVPPPSRKSQQLSTVNSQELEATRALDVADVQMGGLDSERTMALDTSATSGSAGANAATMALDLDQARAQLAGGDAKGKNGGKGKDGAKGADGAKGKDSGKPGPAAAEAAAHGGPSVRNLLLLLVVAVVVVGGAVVVLLTGKEEAKPAPRSAEIAAGDNAGGQDRAGQGKSDQERADQEKADKEKADKEKAGNEKADQEKADKEKADKEKADKEKAESEKAAAAGSADASASADGGAAPAGAGQAGAAAVPAGAVPGGAVPGGAPGAAATEVRKVRLESTPPGASVLVDGKEVGTTPCDVPLKSGEGKKVTVKKAGFDAFELIYSDLYLLAPAKPVYPVTLTASKSVIKKAKPKVEW